MSSVPCGMGKRGDGMYTSSFDTSGYAQDRSKVKALRETAAGPIAPTNRERLPRRSHREIQNIFDDAVVSHACGGGGFGEVLLLREAWTRVGFDHEELTLRGQADVETPPAADLQPAVDIPGELPHFPL